MTAIDRTQGIFEEGPELCASTDAIADWIIRCGEAYMFGIEGR
jgi:hypothetical protein